MGRSQFIEEPFPETPDIGEIRLRAQRDEAMSLDRHDVSSEGDDQLSGPEFLFGQQQTVQADAEPVHGGADGHEGAVEARPALQIEPHLGVTP